MRYIASTRDIASMWDITCLFAACAVPVHTWTTLLYFNQMPGWLAYLRIWDLLGTFAYAQAFALVESIAVLGIVVLLAIVLPRQFLRGKLVAKGSVLALLILGSAAVIQFVGIKPWLGARPWLSKKLYLGIALFLLALGGSWLMIDRSKRVEAPVVSFVQRLTVLLYLHVPIAFLSVAIVILRNLSRRF
jgi:hypothetical protein